MSYDELREAYREASAAYELAKMEYHDRVGAFIRLMSAETALIRRGYVLLSEPQDGAHRACRHQTVTQHQTLG
jgi:hypothetical protein